MGNLTWRSLTWEDLETWAGANSLKRGRSYRSHVSQLAQTEDGGYLAWVQGSERYATHVNIQAGKLESRCTCPVGTHCKHAVAVVLVALETIKSKKVVAMVGNDDPRWQRLETGDSRRLEPTRGLQNNNLETYLLGLPESQLRDLLIELVARFPNVRELLQNRANMQGADGQQLLFEAQRHIAELARFSSYDDYHAIPNTDNLTTALEALHEGQHFDALLGLAPQLMQACNSAIESSHDEGDLHEALRACFDLVIDALPQSSLGRSERLIWLEQTALEDEYEMIDTSSEDDEFWQNDPPQEEDWQALAKHFSMQLQNAGDVYRRKRISDLVSLGLARGGRGDEITKLFEQEAEQHGEFSRLVEYYIELGQLQNANAAILRGLERNQQDRRIGGYGLHQKWRKLREQEKNWVILAADSAEAFLLRPNIQTFRQLQTDAQQAKHWKTIDPLARAFLETGKATWQAWGLPKTGLPREDEKTSSSAAPHTQTLLELAIQEKNADQVLRWYTPKSHLGYSRYGGYGSGDDAVAGAIAHAYPERAIQIWTGLVERLVTETGQSNYIQSIEYLKKIRAVQQQHKQDAEWNALLEELSTTHKRKPRFIELLQGLRGKSIVDT